MSYVVNFRGRGYTAPDASNPKGISVIAEGCIVAEGERPESNMRIPMAAVEQCKAVFMRQTKCVKYHGDTDGEQRFPTVWLDGANKKKRT